MADRAVCHYMPSSDEHRNRRLFVFDLGVVQLKEVFQHRYLVHSCRS